jgi:myo-inositol-1(or 4)-monophosphatase
LSQSSQSALEVATQTVIEAGNLLLDHLQKPKQIERKEGRANIVTDVDLLSEKRMIALLQREYPDFNILSEESAATTTNSPYTWIIDPLDGTNNYVFGVPFFCVALALANREEVLLGLIYDPIRKELFRVEKGGGAFLNDHPIRVSLRTSVKVSFIGCDLGYDAQQGRRPLEMILALWPGIHGLRIIGSAALGLAYVASGRFDLYIHPSLYPWDLAGGILLIREAGGEVTDWEQKPATIHSKQLIAGNKAVYQEFMRWMKQSLSSPNTIPSPLRGEG